jgi:predicted nuclease of predicted toxin-antitoxin system
VIRVLLDQGLPLSTAEQLRAMGWDAVHVAEIGMTRATDRAILAHGLNDDHAIITLDSDFHTLLALSNRHKPSVVRIRREGLRGAALANLLVSVWTSVGQAIVHGAMVTVTESNIRVRYLPIGGDAA